MQILSIALQNIKSHRDTTLQFSPGINVLSGPNGIGKSTIFEAIGYALFGVDAQSFVGNVERFISIGAKKGEIRVVFQLADEQQYRVSRTVGAPSKWLLAREVAGEFEVEEHKDAKETEARIKGLLGLDNGRPLAEQFELVIGPFQNEFLGPFVIKQMTKRRDKFDEILGIDTWRKTFNETKHLGKAIEGKIKELQAALQPLQQQVEVLPEKRLELTTATAELQKEQGGLEGQKKALERLEKQLATFDMQQQQLQLLHTEIATLQQRIGNGQEKVALQQVRTSDAEQANRIVAENEAGKKAFEQAEATLQQLRQKQQLQRRAEQDVAAQEKQLAILISRYQSEQKSIADVASELQLRETELSQRKQALQLDSSITRQVAELPAARSRVEQLQQQLGQLDGRRDGLQEGQEKLADGICPFFQESCQNLSSGPPSDVFGDKFAELDLQAERLRKELERAAGELSAADAAEQKLKTRQIEIRGIDQQMQQISAQRDKNLLRETQLESIRQQQVNADQFLAQKRQDLDLFKQLEEEIDKAEQSRQSYQPSRDLYLANQQAAAELGDRQQELKKFQALLQQLQNELQLLQEKQYSLQESYQQEQHQLLIREKDQRRESLGILRQKIENLEATIVRLQKEVVALEQLRDEIKTKQAQADQYREKEQLLKFLRNKVFRNVSAHLSERFRKEISMRADRIYRIIAEVDEELCWAENYQIVLRDMVDGELRERVDDQLSGGQTMSAVVALRLALLQTLGARVAFFDEPTSNLDALRRENLAHAFRAIDVGREEVTEHWYDQLFLISHDVAFAEVTDQIVSLDP